MKIKNLLLALICVFALAFTACQKENPKPAEEPAPVSQLATFTGHYQLSVSVDGYYVDDEEAESQMESFDGTMDISDPQVVNGVEQVTVKGYFNFGGGEILQVYNTTGTLDAQGRLVLAKNNFTAASGAELEVSYGSISLGNPLSFTSTLTCELMGYNLRYELSNLASKQK